MALPRPAAWWTDLPSHEARQYARQQLRDALLGYRGPRGQKIPGLRDLYEGFEAADGFDLRRVEGMSAARRERVIALAAELHGQTSQRLFKLVKPRNRAQREALFRYTQQVGISSRHKVKRYLVHTENVHERVRVVRAPVFETDEEGERVVRPGYRVESNIVYPSGVRLQSQKFFFSDYLGRQPVSFDEMVDALEEMLPYMPAGRYALVSIPHGIIGRTADRDSLKSLLSAYRAEYGNASHEGFAEVLLGFHWYGNEREADRSARERARRKLYRTQFKALDQKLRKERARAWGALRKAKRKRKRRR